MRFGVAELDRTRDLAELVGMHPSELVRYVDARSFERTAPDPSMRNHRYRWLTSRSGNNRLIESPKPILRHLQRTILREIVAKIPPHDAAHGFVPGRSVHSAARPHIGQAVLVRLDLEAFFTMVPLGRVHATFRSCGYDRELAHRLVGLTSNAVPASVLSAAPPVARERADRHRRVVRRLAEPHLAQGAPTSPALANLAAYLLDARLSGLARSFGARYTRYADDLAFSGDTSFRRRTDRFVELANRIVTDERFALNRSKTRILRPGERQQFVGLVVNERLNVDRRDVDRLRAELHDAVVHGPAAANRSGVDQYRAHLAGRVAWVAEANPATGRRLDQLFDRIDWSGT